MSIVRRKLKGGAVSWGYQFSVGPRATREQHKQGGFATKKEAELAESKEKLRAAALAVPTANPKSLGAVIASFIEDRKAELSPKTVRRYGELAAYLSIELRGQPIQDVTALMLHHEWKRLSESGGHVRQTKAKRPLSAKTVRNIAGVVSAAFSWAILYELVKVNPTTASKPPQSGERRRAVAFAPFQQDIVIEAASGPWCIAAFLEVCAGLGARRGEVLALRWSDIRDGHAHISRSLCQVGSELTWKAPKTSSSERRIEIPARTLSILDSHRKTQAVHRANFGADYRADLDLIFGTPEGDPLKPDSVSSAVSLLCRRLKLPKGANLHALRHSHGSQLLKDGVPLAEVSARLGHANPGVTLGVYAHEIPGTGSAAAVWDAAQQKKTKEKRQ